MLPSEPEAVKEADVKEHVPSSDVVRTSRKRSHDDSCTDRPEPSNLESPSNIFAQPAFGEDTALISPSGDAVMAVESHTGQWLDEQHTVQSQLLSGNVNDSQNTLTEPSRKLPRVESSSGSIASDGDIDPSSQNAEHPIDQLALNLGKGWTQLKTDPDSQAAARGWAKFIERRFHLLAVKVLGMRPNSAFLVEATSGYYAFKEDLGEGIFLGATWDACLFSIKNKGNTIFEWGEMLRPIVNPDVIESGSPATCADRTAGSISSTDNVIEPCPPASLDPWKGQNVLNTKENAGEKSEYMDLD
ncbi:MAG: hypothetical protein Q9190_004465 [Brigantiaea leucoxantha]